MTEEDRELVTRTRLEFLRANSWIEALLSVYLEKFGPEETRKVAEKADELLTDKLIQIETTNPALAARLQQVLEQDAQE